MGICEQVAEAASGISSGLQSPLGNRLLNALNAIGAADIGLRLGSGGQVGVGDLPGLFNTAGIPCYSPELGDTIYVTPNQWYGNSMSCDGLRDPDREELQRRVDELQRQADARNRIRDAGYEIPNEAQIPPEMEDFLNNLPPPSDGFNTGGNVAREMLFLAGGILNIKNITSSWDTVSSWGWIRGSYSNSSRSDPFSTEQKISISPGDRIRTTTQRTGWSRIQKGLVDNNLRTWPEGQITKINSLDLYKTDGEIINLARNRYSSGFSNAPYEFYSRYTEWGFFGMGGYGTYANLDFEPNGAPQDTNGFTPNYPINPNTPEPPEEPCMGGCSCGQMANQNQRQNQNLERLVKEIHKTLGADKFAGNGYPFQPETLIEKQGKTIYAQNPGRGGTITVGNLLEAVSALISANYHRSGLHRFPAKVPDSLIPKTNAMAEAIDIDEITLNDAMAFQKWWFDQWEAATGEYPIKYKITDDGKTEPVSLWNQSEILAEMFGMLCKIQEDSDLGVQWGIRGATEGSKAGNAALKSLHLLQELTKFTGCLTSNGNDDFIKTTCTFSPDPTLDPSKAEEMLKPSAQDIQVTNIVDGRSLLGILMNINYWAQIAGRANYGNMGAANPAIQTPRQNINMPGDGIKEIRKKERTDNKKWDEWKTQTQTPNTTIPVEQQPPGGLPTPNIIEIPKTPNQKK